MPGRRLRRKHESRPQMQLSCDPAYDHLSALQADDDGLPNVARRIRRPAESRSGGGSTQTKMSAFLDETTRPSRTMSALKSRSAMDEGNLGGAVNYTAIPLIVAR